ncbi:MAG: sugar phosphate isomerase/epimerase [Saprospiraceae bacterium]|nr:sugar phosphate isomerase/epimerase [Saprospiraceae bacterium]
MSPKITRRQHLKSLVAIGASAALMPITSAKPLFKPISIDSSNKRDIYIFSKHLQWLDYEAMADTAARMGFDGIDLTVRSKGHVLPENVTKDLPRAVNAIRKAGLKADLLTTSITSIEEPYTEAILKTAGELGIKTYRTGWLTYKPGVPVLKQLDAFHMQFKALAKMNKRYSLQGAYQNHSGTGVGASLWDIWYLIKDLDARYMGVQFDVRHAMVESLSAWQVGLQLLAPYINTLDIKDFDWIKKDGKQTIDNVPLGTGLIDFNNYFPLVDKLNVHAPLCLHLEYPLGGANDGESHLSIPATEVIEAMKRDLNSLKQSVGN